MRVYSESKFEVSFSLAPLLWARPLITLGTQDPTTVHLVAEKKKREEQTRPTVTRVELRRRPLTDRSLGLQ